MGVLAVGLGVGQAVGRAAAEPAAVGGEVVHLSDAIRSTLARSPEIAASAQALEVARGALEAASGRFDLTLDAQLGQRGEHAPATPSAPGDTASATSATTTYTTSYQLGLSQELRSGLRLVPHVAVQRIGGSWLDPAYAEAQVGITVTQPLLRGRGRASTGARERAAQLDAEAEALRARHVAAGRVLAAVQSYWSYRAAWETVEIVARAEERAERFLAEERRMVEAHERAPSELHQVRAALAEARSSRADAARGYLAARQQLGLAMGLGWQEIEALAAPGDPLDAARAGAAPETPARWIALALARRADLQASRGAAQASEVLAGAAERDLGPRLDMTAELGYTGFASGNGGAPLVSALGRDAVGPNFFAGLALELPTANHQARGALRQERARRAALAIATADLERTIGASVALSLRELASLQQQLEGVQEAVDGYLAARDNELRKLRSNLSTEFDVLQIESRLTAAQLSAVRVRVSVLQVLARLRFETGTLLDEEPDAAPTASERLLVVPAPAAR